MNSTDNAVVLYQTPDGATSLAVHLEKETVWLTQKQMAELFGKTVPTINEQIKNVFKNGELEEESVIRNFRITAADGKSNVQKMHFAFSDTINSSNSENVYV